jgi:hypothetical protein
MQGEHEAAEDPPAVVEKPPDSEHGVHAAVALPTSADHVPGKHGVQNARPSVSAYVPAAQATHEAALVELDEFPKVPLGQLAHARVVSS